MIVKLLTAVAALTVGLSSVAAWSDPPDAAKSENTAVDALLYGIGVRRQSQAAFLSFAGITQQQCCFSMEKIIKNYRDEIIGHPRDVEDFKSYCAASIAARSFAERDKLSVEALGLLRKGQTHEANLNLDKVNELSRLDWNLAGMACQP